MKKDKKATSPSSIIRPWRLLESKVLNTFHIGSLRQDIRQSPITGKNYPFIVFDTPDWINIIPVTPEGNIVLIRQFRHGSGTIVWEIPGGMVDPEDKNPEQAARRELLEETGYKPKIVKFLGTVQPNPAIQNNFCHTFLALDCLPFQDQKLDTSEDIEVLEASWAEIENMINEGLISHSIVLTAFFWYQRHLDGIPPPPLQK